VPASKLSVGLVTILSPSFTDSWLPSSDVAHESDMVYYAVGGEWAQLAQSAGPAASARAVTPSLRSLTAMSAGVCPVHSRRVGLAVKLNRRVGL
jgi:hypothetical protein